MVKRILASVAVAALFALPLAAQEKQAMGGTETDRKSVV